MSSSLQTTRFVSSYGLDQKLAAQKHVEFLLSLPEGYAEDDNAKQRPASSPGHYDVRTDLRVCERAAKDTLVLLPSTMARAAILRRCLVSLEEEEKCFKDYERHSFVVSLYLSELALVLADKSNKSGKSDKWGKSDKSNKSGQSDKWGKSDKSGKSSQSKKSSKSAKSSWTWNSWSSWCWWG